ncbi:MAG: CDP-alcohol phosphatidyltransferase family protein, partial [Bacteroidota bacterium]
MQRSFKRHLPNLLTLLNLLSGCLASVAIIDGEVGRMAFFLLSGLVFDLFDGLVARALKVSSPFGKELDSLADMVTFGFLPGLLMYSKDQIIHKNRQRIMRIIATI